MSGAAAGPSRPDPIVELCAFVVGDEEYVIDIRRIREIVQPLPTTAVPRAPEWMDGVVNLRGEVVPVVQVRRRLGFPPAPQTRRTKMLIVHVGGRVLALLVDGVSEVIRIPRSRIGPPPAMGQGGGAPVFLGVCGARSAAGRSRSGGTNGDDGGARGAAPQRLRLLLNVKALVDGPAPRPQPATPPRAR